MTIYFIGSAAGPIKIGRTQRLSFRVRDLQLASPIRLTVLAQIEDVLTRELEYHRRFRQHRLHGEWFAPAPDILAEIEQINSVLVP